MTKKQQDINDPAVNSEIDKKFGDNKKQAEFAKEYFSARVNRKLKPLHSKLPDYHKFGLPLALYTDVKAWIEANFDKLLLLAQGAGEAATALQLSHVEHTKSVISEFKNAFYERECAIQIDESSVSPSVTGTKIMSYVLQPKVAAYTIGGMTLGFYNEVVYEAMLNTWKWFTDWLDGKATNVKEVERYAEHVRAHVDKRTHIMIEDLKNALEKKEWIKAARIQQELKVYGKKAGYKIEEEMGGVGAVGAPTNNVGSGLIAGTTNDPPVRQRKRVTVLRRRNKIAEETYSPRRGSYVSNTIGYVAVNKKGGVKHTSSLAVAKRHASSFGKKRKNNNNNA
jgi:hypothetical protein